MLLIKLYSMLQAGKAQHETTGFFSSYFQLLPHKWTGRAILALGTAAFSTLKTLFVILALLSRLCAGQSRVLTMNNSGLLVRCHRATAWGDQQTGPVALPSLESLKPMSHESLPSKPTRKQTWPITIPVLSFLGSKPTAVCHWRASIFSWPPTGLEGNQSQGRGWADYTRCISALHLGSHRHC